MSWKHLWAAASAVALLASAGAGSSLAQSAPANAPTGAAPHSSRLVGPARGQAATATAAAAAAGQTAATPPAAPTNSESVAAIVNDEVISTYDVRQRAQLILISAGVQPTQALVQRATQQAVHDLVDEHLQLQETGGERFHIQVTDAEIDNRIGDIARGNNIDVATFTQRLTGAGASMSSLRQQIKADIAWNRLMSGLYHSRIRISESEIADTQARIAAGASSTHYLVSEIFLPAATPQEFQQMTDGANRLLEQMQHGAPFPAVARQFSAAPSAAAGGDIGWMAANELPAEVSAVTQRLQAGQVSMPITAPNGVYIVAVRDRREGQAAGSATQLTLKEVTAPGARRPQLERLQRRSGGCTNLERDVGQIAGAQTVDLGQTTEANLSDAIRTRIANVAGGSATPVDVTDNQASLIFVCSRETGGSGVPSHDEIENRLMNQEMSMLSERYLRNLRREATIITR